VNHLVQVTIHRNSLFLFFFFLFFSQQMPLYGQLKFWQEK
jgi:hypothetical protein